MKRPVRIAHIMPFASLGGTEVAALRIMRGLDSRRFAHTVFCFSEAEEVRQKFASAGMATADYDNIELSLRQPFPYLRQAAKLALEFRRRKIDLVHCQEVLAAYRTVLAGKLAGLPVLCHVRAQRAGISRRERYLLAGVNHFVFVSQNTWDSFGVPVSWQRGSVIYDGLDPIDIDNAACAQSVRAEFGLASDTPIVGMVSRVAREKDFTTLIKAAERVLAVRPEVKFFVVGDYSSLSGFRQHYVEVQKMLAACGIAKSFIFTDHREDVARLRAAMDICVLCSHTEGFGLAVLEGMAQGKPVLATAVGGLAEAVTDGITGLLHRHEDAVQLATQILDVLAHPTLAARLGRLGRQAVINKFNQQDFIRGIGDLYGALLGGRSNGGKPFVPNVPALAKGER